MTIILLIVDTSASMAQKTYLGTSCLDVARNIIDALQKQRMKDVATRGYDRFFLITTEEYPACIKSGWRESSGVLHDQLKKLRPRGRGSISDAFMNALKFINVHRAQTGIDNYGCGRFPTYFEPVVIFAITDSTSVAEIHPDFRLAPTGRPYLGSEMTLESFRWDQRLYTCVLRYPSKGMRVNLTPPIILPTGGHVIESLCGSTGGRSYLLQSHKLISAMIDHIVQAIQLTGIIVRFECPVLANIRETNEENLPDREKARLRLRNHMETKPLTLIYVKSVGGRPPTGHWPIPEAFWHDRIEKAQLPPRRAHPCILFSIDPVPAPTIQTDLPFDKYQLEPSPIAEYILDRHGSTSANMCYQVFVRSSSRTEGVGKPFGYLKTASNGQFVNLFIMPYNYPVIVQLLEEYKNDPRVRSAGNWRARLDRYVEAMPPYYLTPLRNALSKMKMEASLLDERGVSLSQVYPASLLNYLNDLKTQGKEEFEKTCTTLSVLLQQNMAPLPIVPVEHVPYTSPSRCWQPLYARMKDRVSRRDQREHRESELMRDPEAELSKLKISPQRSQLHIHLCEPRVRAPAGCRFRNPFIVPAREMVEELPRLRANLDMTLRESPWTVLDGGPPGITLRLHNSDEIHQLPIAQMGNYEEYIKGMAAIGRVPPRPIEPTPVRTHAFGNPFKTDKKSLAIDEVGEGPVGANTSVPTAKESRRERAKADVGKPPKRKPGPMPANSMQQWRERRKSLSTTSSVVSDLSYISDLDLEVPSTSGETVQDIALNDVTNGLENASLIEAGLEPEAESGDEKDDESEPLPKRRKIERLTEQQLHDRKVRIAQLVRRHQNNGATWTDLCRDPLANVSLLDQLDLTDFALRDARRFKRRALVDQLNAECQRIRKLVAI